MVPVPVLPELALRWKMGTGTFCFQFSPCPPFGGRRGRNAPWRAAQFIFEVPPFAGKRNVNPCTDSTR